MKCRTFETDLPDWLRGRIAPDRAAAMEAHENTCARCRLLSEGERDLQQNFPCLAVPYIRQDLWPAIAARLADAELRARHRPSAGLLKWAMAGALAAVIGFAAVRTAVQPKQVALARPEDEAKVVRMITSMEPIRYVESDFGPYDVSRGQDTQRALLVGDSGR